MSNTTVAHESPDLVKLIADLKAHGVDLQDLRDLLDADGEDEQHLDEAQSRDETLQMLQGLMVQLHQMVEKASQASQMNVELQLGLAEKLGPDGYIKLVELQQQHGRAMTEMFWKDFVRGVEALGPKFLELLPQAMELAKKSQADDAERWQARDAADAELHTLQAKKLAAEAEQANTKAAMMQELRQRLKSNDFGEVEADAYGGVRMTPSSPTVPAEAK